MTAKASYIFSLISLIFVFSTQTLFAETSIDRGAASKITKEASALLNDGISLCFSMMAEIDRENLGLAQENAKEAIVYFNNSIGFYNKSFDFLDDKSIYMVANTSEEQNAIDFYIENREKYNLPDNPNQKQLIEFLIGTIDSLKKEIDSLDFRELIKNPNYQRKTLSKIKSALDAISAIGILINIY